MIQSSIKLNVKIKIKVKVKLWQQQQQTYRQKVSRNLYCNHLLR